MPFFGSNSGTDPAAASTGNVNKDAAIDELLVLCAEKGVDIPESVRSILSSDGDSNAKSAATLSASSNGKEKGSGDADTVATISSILDEEISRRKLSIMEYENEDPLIKQVRETYQQLKFSRHKYDLRITNGSYTVVNKVKEDYNLNKVDAVDAVEEAEDGFDEEGGKTKKNKSPKKENKPHIDTVTSSNHMIQFVKKLIHCCRTGEFQMKEREEEMVIMDSVNLCLESGKMYLVLGAPGCGKSSLLKMIAQNLRVGGDKKFGGSVTINGVGHDDKEVHWTNLVGYIDQIDRLHSLLTVKETCDFAFKCRLGDHRKGAMPKDDPQVNELLQKMDDEDWLVMMLLKAMGLEYVKDTFVGDDSKVRGVSGGQRKRVTVTEMSAIGAPIICYDEMSTGLDAATTYDITRLMGQAARWGNSIKIVSLLQPPPETVALFDEVILLDRGRVIFAGPIDEVVGHFTSLGYKIPPRMDPADWLQTLPTPDGASFLVDDKQKHLTNEEFVENFVQSERGQILAERLKAPLSDSIEPIKGEKEFTKQFHNSWWKSTQLVFEREALLWWRDKYQLKARIMQDLVMGIVVGTVFWQVQDNPQSVVGVLYQSLFFISMGAMLKVAPQIDVRGVFYKQQDANFFPTSSFVIGRSMAALPTSIIDALFYGTVIYWFTGLAYNEGASVANFFVFLLLVLVTAYSSGLMFSIFSAIIKDRPTAQACMSITVVVLVLFSGFTVQPDVIPAYWIWVYWINLFAWMLRALLVNEYQSGKYDEETYPGSGETVGESILTRFGFTLNGEAFGYEWVWWGVLFAFALCIVSVWGSVFSLKKVRFETGKSLAAHMMDSGEDEDDDPAEEVVLDFQKVNLTFKDIHYTVTSSITKEPLPLLNGITGFLAAGKMTALMGESGAGKTTLMDVLALRKSSGEITGEVRLNGHLQESKSFRRCTGYVEQFDTQTPQLTIRETVAFSAKMRLDETDPAVTPENIESFVDQTLCMLELTAIQHYLVGSDLAGGLSFEQKKRLSIAVELAANPSIIFLDEPTSGLDARAASIVMKGMRRIADSGRAVVATIHQPSVAIFNDFDSLLLLKKGGFTTFFGELGEESCKLIEYLERFPSTNKIKPGENPATWMLTVTGAGSGSGGEKPFDYAASYSASQLHKDAVEKIEGFDSEATEDNLITFASTHATSTKTQKSAVFKRMWKVYWRSPGYNRVRTIVAAIIALLFGSVYASNRTPQNESDMNSRVTSIYITVLFLGVNAFNTILPVYEVERNMFYRHKAALMYGFRSFNRAWTLAELPFICFSAMVFVVCFYFLVGLSTLAYKFFLYYLFVALNGAMWTFLGQAFMALFKDTQTAQGSGAVLIGLSSIFTGLLIRPQYITGFWLWAYHSMPGHYVLEGLLASQFHQDNTIIEPWTGSPYWIRNREDCVAEGIISPDFEGELPEQCWGTAEEWIEVSFGGLFTWEHVPFNVIYCLAVLVIAKVVSYWALRNLDYLAK